MLFASNFSYSSILKFAIKCPLELRTTIVEDGGEILLASIVDPNDSVSTEDNKPKHCSKPANLEVEFQATKE